MKQELKQKSFALREKGYSLKEMEDMLNVSKSTLSLWTRNIKLSPKAQKRLESRYTKGQLASQKVIKEKTKQKNAVSDLFAKDVLDKVVISKDINILICTMVWWCEGNKGMRNGVVFTNSDPDLIKFFLRALRKSFDLDESKFRILMHLHNYHNEETQKSFWSRVTKVSKKQFNRSYIKPSNGIYKKENYQGCIKVAYNDVTVARKLESVAKLAMERYK